MYEVEIISRSVILRKAAPNAPHQAANREIEAGRAVLPFVVTIRGELQNLGGFALVAQNMRRGPVDRGTSAAALLVMESTCVPDARQNQPVLDALNSLAVLR